MDAAFELASLMKYAQVTHKNGHHINVLFTPFLIDWHPVMNLLSLDLRHHTLKCLTVPF